MSWDGLKNQKDKPVPTKSIDGYLRTPEEEKILNKHFANLFKGDEGKKVLDYFRDFLLSGRRGYVGCGQ